MSADFTSVDLSALIRRVVKQFEPLVHRDGIEIETRIADGCRIPGNAELLERMVYNLIDNALRHTGEKRKIDVSLIRGETITFEVRDYGEGIEESDLPHIWEKYYTKRQRGNKSVSGLGLAIVKQIAEIHDAEYGVDSKKDEGSGFWIKLKKQ